MLDNGGAASASSSSSGANKTIIRRTPGNNNLRSSRPTTMSSSVMTATASSSSAQPASEALDNIRRPFSSSGAALLKVKANANAAAAETAKSRPWLNGTSSSWATARDEYHAPPNLIDTWGDIIADDRGGPSSSSSSSTSSLHPSIEHAAAASTRANNDHDDDDENAVAVFFDARSSSSPDRRRVVLDHLSSRHRQKSSASHCIDDDHATAAPPRIVERFHSDSAADLSMAMNVMETLYERPRIRTYALVATGGDANEGFDRLAPLVTRLQNAGKVVVGYGYDNGERGEFDQDGARRSRWYEYEFFDANELEADAAAPRRQGAAVDRRRELLSSMKRDATFEHKYPRFESVPPPEIVAGYRKASLERLLGQLAVLEGDFLSEGTSEDEEGRLTARIHGKMRDLYLLREYGLTPLQFSKIRGMKLDQEGWREVLRSAQREFYAEHGVEVGGEVGRECDGDDDDDDNAVADGALELSTLKDGRGSTDASGSTATDEGLLELLELSTGEDGRPTLSFPFGEQSTAAGGSTAVGGSTTAGGPAAAEEGLLNLSELSTSDGPTATEGGLLKLTDNRLSTVGRIAEIIADSGGGLVDPPSSEAPPSQQHQWPNNNESIPSAKIESILDWYERLGDDEPRSRDEAIALARLCNKMLAALGNATLDDRRSSDKGGGPTNNVAKVILDRIISLSISFEEDAEPKGDPSCSSPSPFLDADTFNAYIRCLPLSNPLRSASSAEDLLRRGRLGQTFRGAPVPKPNVGTYNAVMARWAMAKGVDGRDGANGVYSLLMEDSAAASESSEWGKPRQPLLRPNKASFEIILAANSRTDDGKRFSFERARAGLYNIEETAHSAHVSTRSFKLDLDADIFSAALGCPPSSSSSLERISAYDGSGGENDESNGGDAANDIVMWLLHAEERGMVPDARMYEAVVGAYVRAGTREGLLTAEEWAKRAIISNSPIQLETFRPIIDAWALCGSEQAPARVTEWINSLAQLGATKPHLKPDWNILSAQITAWRNVQAGLMTRLKEPAVESIFEKNSIDGGSVETTEERFKTIFSLAQSCSQFLEVVHSDWSAYLDSPREEQAMVSMFTNTVKSWGCASRAALLCREKSDSCDDVSHCVDEMMKIARYFDADLDSEDKSDKEDVLYSMRESFAEIISQLLQIDSAMVDSDIMSTSYFFQEMAEVERMLRGYDSYSQSQLSHSDNTPKINALRHRMYREVLHGCASVKSPDHYDSIIGICRLIMDHLAMQNDAHQFHDNVRDGDAKVDITHIYVDMALLVGTIVKDEDERMDFLADLHNNASQFFQRRFNASKYATVHATRLTEAMRGAMGDSENTEPFLCDFEKRPKKNKPQGTNAWSFVQNLMRQRHK